MQKGREEVAQQQGGHVGVKLLPEGGLAVTGGKDYGEDDEQDAEGYGVVGDKRFHGGKIVR